MPEIHARFIICIHVVIAQCLSYLYIILPRPLVSSNKTFRITIPPLSIIISVLFREFCVKYYLIIIIIIYMYNFYAPINVSPHPHPSEGGEFLLFGTADLPQGLEY